MATQKQIFEIETNITKYPMKKKFIATNFESAYEVANHQDFPEIGSINEELHGQLRSVSVEAAEVEGTFYIYASYDLLP